MITVYDVIKEIDFVCHNADATKIGEECALWIPEELKLEKGFQNQKYTTKTRKTRVRFYKDEAKPLIMEQVAIYKRFLDRVNGLSNTK
jgi:hypothetical protein